MKEYTIENDCLPRYSDQKDDLRLILSEWRPQTEPALHPDKKDLKEIRITDVGFLNGFEHRGNDYYGSCPEHASDKCRAVHVSVSKNLWKCFAHDSGGDGWYWLAVNEKIIRCEQARSGGLREQNFKKTLSRAVELGLIERPKRKKEKEVKEVPWKTVTETIPCVDPNSLFDGLVDWLKRYNDYKDPRYYSVKAAWIEHTWLIEDWIATGPLYLLGLINVGKTRGLECLEETAYLGVRGGSMTEAVMKRLGHKYGCAFLIDESQIYNREEFAVIQAYINERYRKGGRTWVCDEDNDPIFFNAYGCTAFASSAPPWLALQSRAIIFHLHKNTRPVEKSLTKKFYEEGQELRNLLAGFRCRFKGQLGEIEPQELNQIRDSRTQEIAQPLLAIPKPEEAQIDIINYFRDLEEEHRVEEETDNEADYVRALLLCEPENGKLTALEIQDKLADALNLVEYRVKRGVLGEEKERVVDKRYLPGPKTVLKVLTTLGFRKLSKIGKSGRAGILWDPDLITRLKIRFRLEGDSSQPPQPPQPPPGSEKQAEEAEEAEANQKIACELCHQPFNNHREYERHRCPLGTRGIVSE